MTKENKMGTMPIPKLILNMSLPIMASMLVQALYNIVDSIFVARYNAKCITAISLAFPIQSLMIAFSVGTSVGMNSLLSRRLGEKHFDDANAAAKNGIFVSVLTSLVFALFGIFFSRMFMSAFTADQEVIKMGTEYIFICTVFSVFIFMQVALERILQATGRSLLSMFSQASGALTNIVLDPILIFGLFGMPEMGIVGAAAATVIGQLVSMIVALVLNIRKNHEVSISFARFCPNGRIIGEIYAVGLPSVIMQAITSVMTVGMNKILASDMAVSVFGIYFRLQSFIFMPVFGLTNGLIPIIGYNFGARKKERITHAIRLGVIWAVSIMIIGFAVFELAPAALLALFKAEGETMSLGISALRIIALSFPIAGFCIVCSSTYQAIGNGVLSLILSVMRQLVIILPAAWILKHTLGLSAVWFSFPLAEIFGLVFCTVTMRSIYKNKISVL